MDARCQCGSVAFKTPLPEPLALYICHCAECRRQTSSAFGTSAIFPRFKLPDSDLLSCYARPTPSGQTLYCYFCRNCGTRLFHTTPAKNVVSVKGGCIEGLDWKRPSTSGPRAPWCPSRRAPRRTPRPVAAAPITAPRKKY
ncbi:hypothetical protein ACCO45_007128 [Purpureocillium lilacinum]|uniref:Uncharacterized protein n=1 Tax=Purpureocillium lilacinum TaxID=33203 RepID=A0ACC4DRG6_PURLI